MFVNLKNRVYVLKRVFSPKMLSLWFFKIKKLPLNALNLIYCKFHIAQIIIKEDIDNIIKGALEVFISVCTCTVR